MNDAMNKLMLKKMRIAEKALEFAFADLAKGDRKGASGWLESTESMCASARDVARGLRMMEVADEVSRGVGEWGSRGVGE